MKKIYADVLVLGAGAAGLAAAAKAKELGAEHVILLDEKEELGGVLPQCIHPGFGLHYYREDLTGPEFAFRLYEKVRNLGVEVHNQAYAIELIPRKYDEKIVRASSPEGLLDIHAKTVIFATGARERQRYEIGIIGYRPIGVYTAGQAQTMMDLYGMMPGKEIVIVGSGDVGLIMARRFALQGAHVKAVIEILPYPGGLTRNIQQCLIDFGIPLYLSHKVISVNGTKRVEGVIVGKVDEKFNTIPGSEFEIKCDTLIVSAGLLPRVELLMRAGAFMDPATKSAVVNEYLETTIPGVFLAGNALVINDLVDYAAEQGEAAATSAIKFIQEGGFPSCVQKSVVKGRNVRLIVPQLITGENDVFFYGRVSQPEEDVYLKVPEVGMKLRMLRVKPPEMLRFKIRKKQFENLEGDKITISVEPRSEG